MKQLLSVLFATLLTLGVGFSATPELVNYQGYVTDSNGVAIGDPSPVNRKIVFRVYNVSTGGTAIWAEEHTSTIADGRFSVLLGNGATFNGEPHDNLNTVFGTGSEFYIGITVDDGDNTFNESDTEISPRQRIVSSVFALRAKTAESVSAGQDLSLGAESGLGYYDGTRQFNGQTINGPVLFGSGGGALGSLNAGTSNTALRWDTSGGISIINSLGLGTSANILLNDRPLYLRSDTNHALQYVGTHNGVVTNGPLLYGFDGGMLGFSNNNSSGDNTRALYWTKKDNTSAIVTVNGDLNTGGLIATGTAQLNGGISTSQGILAIQEINTSANLRSTSGLFLIATDNNHGVALKATFAGQPINGPVVFGYGGGALGIVNGTETPATNDDTEEYALIWNSGGKVSLKNDLDVPGDMSAAIISASNKITIDSKDVPVAEESLRFIRGGIDVSEANSRGSGFAVAKVNTGIYEIIYSTAFPDGKTPSVTVSIDSDGGYDTVSVEKKSHIGFQLIMKTSSGSTIDRDFDFIVAGPRN